MGNEYIGTRFKTTFRRKEIQHTPLFAEFQKWSAIFARAKFAPPVPGGFGGNLSLCDQGSFLITAAGANLARLSEKDIVRVHSYDCSLNTVEVSGCKEPSSETMLHGEIYRARPELQAIFHGHYPLFEALADILNLRITRNEASYGSLELVKEALEVIGYERVIILKNHGFISMGTYADEAGEQVLDLINFLI
ncbi:MAG: class II aldolase/adducin family protein [Candidatus Cloacimonetes bacterium]|nr:class II aldolase/adducin family protein [Candidatus Cloacimonadota bacterium]